MRMVDEDIQPGQRWVSDAEPELGLGVVMNAGGGRVSILFPAADDRREYALETAPVRRVAFEVGDNLKTHDGQSGAVEDVKEEGGFLHYQVKGKWIPEAALADTISFSNPLDRLMGRQFDDPHLFHVRNEVLNWQSKINQSPNRGFTGGRINLIEHQLYLAQEVAGRLQPRVLLADEVGLGKTIEACLILHRLHLTGRAERALIILPESLMHQWFIELLRRFNLVASLFDEERCQAIEGSDPESNPFLDSQIVCVSLDYLTGSHQRYAQVVDTDWDLLIVDEAHHLEWTQKEASTAYQMVEGLTQKIPSVLLLTATPQQLGPEGHFARLRLLDPIRYNDLESFVKESDDYQKLAELVDRIDGNQDLSSSDWEMIQTSASHLHDQYFDKQSLRSYLKQRRVFAAFLKILKKMKQNYEYGNREFSLDGGITLVKQILSLKEGDFEFYKKSKEKLESEVNNVDSLEKLQQKDKIDNARIESQEDIAQLRANINLKKLDAQRK